MYIKIAGNAVAAASQQHFGLPATAAAVRRLFHRSTGVVAMGHGSHVSDNDPKVLEREKQRNLQGNTPEIIPGQPGFNPELASESEAAIHAERAPSLDMEELQQHSVKVLKHLHDGADHPAPGEVHDPSQSPAIKENLERSSQKTDVHDPVNP